MKAIKIAFRYLLVTLIIDLVALGTWDAVYLFRHGTLPLQ